MIELHDAVLINEGRRLFRPVSFSLNSNDAVSLSGKSGMGKTSLLRCLLGLSTPFLFEGRKQLKGPVGYAPQCLDLWPHLSVNETLHMVGRKQSLEWIEELLCGLELKCQSDILARKLSGGEKQRLNLARSLVLRPPLLIWDEPFSSQDIQTKKKIILFIKHYLASSKSAFFLVSHDEKEAKLLAEREVVLTV